MVSCDSCAEQKIQCKGVSQCSRCPRLGIPCTLERANKRLEASRTLETGEGSEETAGHGTDQDDGGKVEKVAFPDTQPVKSYVEQASIEGNIDDRMGLMGDEPYDSIIVGSSFELSSVLGMMF